MDQKMNRTEPPATAPCLKCDRVKDDQEHWDTELSTCHPFVPVPEGGGEVELRIVSGGESLDIYDVMQRFRTDGSCEQLIKRALEKFIDTRTSQLAGEPSVKDDIHPWLTGQCSRLLYGQCTTARCIKRGGWTGGGYDPAIATCEAYEISNVLATQPTPTTEARPWHDAGDHVWEIKQGITCVECPHCLFTFAAVHVSGDQGYECPNCEGCPDAFGPITPKSTPIPELKQRARAAAEDLNSQDYLKLTSPQYPNAKIINQVEAIIERHLPQALSGESNNER